MPAVVTIHDRFAGGVETIDVRAPVAGTASRAAMGEVNMPVEIRIEEEAAAGDLRTIAVRVTRREGIPPSFPLIDRAEIVYTADCAARWRATDGTVQTGAHEPFEAAYFSAPEAFVERRVVEGARCPIAVSARVQLAAPPVPVSFEATAPTALRMIAEVTAGATLAAR